MGKRLKKMALRSLRVRFLSALLLGAALVTAIGSYATYRVAQSHIEKQLIDRSKLLASAINHSAMIAHSDADLQHVVEEVLKDNIDIRTIAIKLSNNQKVIASASADKTMFSATTDNHLWSELSDAIGAGKFGFHSELNQELVLIAPLSHPMPASSIHGDAGGQVSVRSHQAPLPNIHHTISGTAASPAHHGSKAVQTHHVMLDKENSRAHNDASPIQTHHSSDKDMSTGQSHGIKSGHDHAVSTKSDWITQNLSKSDYRGGILLRIDRSGVNATMSNILRGLMPISVFGVLAIIALAFVLLHYLVIAPVDGIRHVMKRQQSGDRQARAVMPSILEFDEVALAFNGMIDAISDREETIKRSEKELAVSLAKEKELHKLQRQFVSMASHEFRTPLAIIDTTAQRMKSRSAKKRLTPEDAAQRVEKIRDAVRRMTRLMESTLDAASMEEGKIKIEIKPCDIGKVVREVCARQQEIDQTHVISCDLAGLPKTIQADTVSLEQVFTNLLSNAVKYAPDAHDIEIKARTEGDHVVISVRDYGIGIDQDDLSRIGERFFRARTSTGIVGMGIGLNMAKTLVEMHEGSFNVESTKGEGSTFTISIPIAGPDWSKQADTKVA